MNLKQKIASRFEKSSNVMAKAAGWYFVCTFLQKIISVLTTPIFTRLLNTSEYGEYSLYLTWYDILSIFITLTLSSSVYQRNVVRAESNKKEITASMLGLATLSTIITFSIYIIFNGLFNKLIGLNVEVIIAIWITSICTTTFEMWAQSQRIDYKYKKLVMLTLVMSIGKPLLSIFMIKFLPFSHITSRVYGNVLIDVMVTLFLYITLISKGRIYNGEVWNKSLKYVIPLLPHYLSQRLLSQSDRIMIDKMIGTSEAGLYSLAYSVGMMLLMLNTVTDSTIAPWVYRNIRDRKYSDIAKLTKKLVIVFSFVLIEIVLLTPEIVMIFASRLYYDAIWCVPPIAISAYVMMIYIQLVYFEYYIGKTIYTTIATVGSAVINIVLNTVLIPILGYTAAAYTTIFCYIIYAYFHYFVVRKLFKEELHEKCIYSFKWLTYSVFLPMCISILCMGLYKLIYIRYLFVVIVGVLFLAYVYLYVYKER